MWRITNSVLEQLICSQPVKKFHFLFFEAERFLLCSQRLSTNPHSEPQHSSVHSPTLFLQHYMNVVFLFLLRDSKWPLPLRGCDWNSVPAQYCLLYDCLAQIIPFPATTLSINSYPVNSVGIFKQGRQTQKFRSTKWFLFPRVHSTELLNCYDS